MKPARGIPAFVRHGDSLSDKMYDTAHTPAMARFMALRAERESAGPKVGPGETKKRRRR